MDQRGAHRLARAAFRWQDDRIKQGQPADPLRKVGGGEQAERAAHGVAGQHHGFEIKRLQEDVQIVAQVEPGIASHGLGGGRRAAMTAKIKGQDAKVGGQGSQDRPIGARVEAVRVHEDRVDRPLARAEVEIGEVAGAGFGLKPKRAGAGLVGDNGVHAASL